MAERSILEGEVERVGHLVVHGGEDFAEPVLIDDDAVARIERLTLLAVTS